MRRRRGRASRPRRPTCDDELQEPETEVPAAKATGPGSKKVNGCNSALVKLQERRAKLQAKFEALEAKGKAKFCVLA